MVAGHRHRGDSPAKLGLNLRALGVAGDGGLGTGHGYSPKSIVGATKPTTGGMTSNGTPFSPPFALAM